MLLTKFCLQLDFSIQMSKLLPNSHGFEPHFTFIPYPYKTAQIHKSTYIKSTYITIIQFQD